MKKIICIIAMILGIINISTVQATEMAPIENYDLLQGGTQIFNELDGNGETVTIEITEDKPMQKLANKTYTVSKKTRIWSVSYKVGIRSNKITKVSNLKTTTVVGYFRNSSLKKVSSTKAKWSATYTGFMLSTKAQCTATVSHNKLIVN